MSYRVTREPILRLSADAAVLGLELTQSPAESTACQALAAAGGEALRRALGRQKYIPLGAAAALEGEGLPFRHLILTTIPRWLNGKCNELLALRRCYDSVLTLAEQLGCERLAAPFLSALYYCFPREEAVHIALSAAAGKCTELLFSAETEELYRLSREAYHKPAIVSYVGWYRDHAVFALDNGQYVRVDLRPELCSASVIPYVEPCYRVGNNPLQAPLPETEILRLQRIYEEGDW